MNCQATLMKRLANASLSKIHPTTSIKGETQLRKTILATGLLNKVRQQQAVSFNDWLLSRHGDDPVSILDDDEIRNALLPTSSPDNIIDGDTTYNTTKLERSISDVNKWDDDDGNRDDQAWGTWHNYDNGDDTDKTCVWNWLIDSVKEMDHENAASILIGLLAPANTTPISTALPDIMSSVMEENVKEEDTPSRYDFMDTKSSSTIKRSFCEVSPSDPANDPAPKVKRVKDSTSRPSSPVTLSA